MKNVNFLGDNFEISSDIKRFFEMCNWFDELANPLKAIFIRKMELATNTDPTDANTMVWPCEEDFQEIRNPMYEVANKVVLRLSKYGYYDITAEDLVEKNPGYIHMHNLSVEVQKRYLKIFYNALNDFSEGMEEAYQLAASNITGSGVGIITNSALDAGLYCLRENGIITQQVRRADAEYSSSMKKLTNTFNNDIQKKVNTLLTKYYPKCFAAIDEFIEDMLNSFMTYLQNVGKLESNILLSYNPSRSETLLSNIDKIDDKKALLQSAFKQCPYDPDIYYNAIIYGYGSSSLAELMKDLDIASSVTARASKSCENPQFDINMVSNVISFMRKNDFISEKDCKAIAQKANPDIMKSISDLWEFASNGGGKFSAQKKWIYDNNIAYLPEQLLDKYSTIDVKQRIKNAINKVYSDENLSRLQIYYTGSSEKNSQEEVNQKKEELSEKIFEHVSECMNELSIIHDKLKQEQNVKNEIDSQIDDLKKERDSLSVFKISLRRELLQEIEKQELKRKDSLQKINALERQYAIN